MFPPLLRVLLDEPRLVIDYASAYATLLKEDATWWKAQQMRRLGWLLAMVVSVLLAIGFAGIALMLSAVTGSRHWMLWVVPLLPLTVAIAASWLAGQGHPTPRAFPRVRAQVKQDMQLFDTKEPNDELRT